MNTLSKIATSAKSKEKHFPFAILLFVTVIITVGFRNYQPLLDSDIWFHLVYGQYFWENWTLIPDHSLYSWTPGSNERIYCAWIAELVLYGFFSLGGIPALLVFRFFCMVFFVIAVALYAKKLGIFNNYTVWLVCLLGVLMSYAAGFVKPEMFSYVYMTLLCWLWWHLKSVANPKLLYIYLLPLLMVIWVNSHGGVIFGYFFLFIVAIGEFINRILGYSHFNTRTSKHLFFSFLLCGCALFCSPYGWHYPWQLIQYYAPTGDNVQLIESIHAYGSPYGISDRLLSFGRLADIALIVLVLTLLPLIKRRSIEFTFLLSNIAFAVLFSKFQRTTYFWAPVYVFSMLYIFSIQTGGYYSAWKQHIGQIKKTAILAICLFLASLGCFEAVYHPISTSFFGTGNDAFSPYEEAEFIKLNYPGIKEIGNTYGLGAYLIWKLWPDQKVMMDARHFPYREWFNDFMAFTWSPSQSNFEQKNHADLWIVDYKQSQLLFFFHKSPDWTQIFQGKAGVVFLHKNFQIRKNSVSKKYNFVHSIKSIQAAIDILTYALAIEDFEGVDIILERMKKLRWSPFRADIQKDLQTLQDGYKAYSNDNYEQTINLINKTQFSAYGFNSRILSASSFRLGTNLWEAGNDLQALKYFQNAYLMSSDIHALFNVGMIGGFLSYQNGGNIDDKELWRKTLELFIKMNDLKNAKTPEHKNKMIKYNRVAKEMLDGSNVERPRLLPER